MSTEEQVIWRFMDFTKYVSMLHERALFFARADQLPDPFEGSLTHRYFPNRPPRGVDAPEGRHEQVLLNCWYSNEHESAAMWRIYSTVENGVAIRSTVARLKTALAGGGHQLRIGPVEYMEPENVTLAKKDPLEHHFRKRKSFAYEQEIRALLSEEQPLAENGRYLPADLDRLVERVVVAPPSEPWFEGLVRSVSEKYGFHFQVQQSEMTPTD